MKILGIAGSNSKNSINKELLTYILSNIHNHEIKVLDINNYEMPIYSIDRQLESGFPKLAEDFFNEIKEAEALVITLAEHNGNFSVAFKNILDWVSRIDMSFLKNKKLLVVSTSPGSYGGGNVLEIGLKYFEHFAGGEIIESAAFPFFGENFKDGKIINEEQNNIILEKIKTFEKSLN